MNNKNKKIIKNLIDDVAKYLDGQLPWSLNRHGDRSSYVYVESIIEKIMGKSHEECKDEDVENLSRLIKNIKNNPF
jgi:hypothetical protein